MATPIRLAVQYQSAEALVTEYARSLAKGGCVIVAKRPLPHGTQFVFEMSAPHHQPLEIEGHVLGAQPTETGYEIGVVYSQGETDQHELLESLVADIAIDPTYETLRRHPRIPVNLVAQVREMRATISITNLSRGGMQIECYAARSVLAMGARLMTAITLGGRAYAVPGTIVWANTTGRKQQAGVRFDALDAARITVVDQMLRLQRPEHLEIDLLPEVPLARGTRTRISVQSLAQQLFETAARDYLVRRDDLALEPLAETVHALERDTSLARVEILGDLRCELVLDASPAVGAALASQLLGEDVAHTDHDLINDALAETLTSLAGHICDQFEHANRALEVSPPFHDQAQRRANDLVRVLAFRTHGGILRLTIVVRAIA